MYTSTPKISVLMSVYNGESYLRESVESILNQTFTDFEFVIIDDCSLDDSWKILLQYAERDRRIKLYQNEVNLGLTRSLNKGIKLARGEYIARQDADDISLPNRLQLQVKFLDAHPEVGALGSSVEFIDRQGKVLRQVNVPQDQETLQTLLLVNNCLWHPSTIFATKLVQQLNGYDENIIFAQDYDLWWRIGRNAHLANLPEILLRYRQDNPAAITKLKRKKQLQCSQQISYRAISESLQNDSLAPIDAKAYERFWWTYLELIDKHSYQKWWYEERGQDGLLQQHDLSLLQPLWNLLASNPTRAKILGTRLYRLSNHLLRTRQTSLGLQLLWILRSKLRISIQWHITIKALLKPYVPSISQRIWMIGKLGVNNIKLQITKNSV